MGGQRLAFGIMTCLPTLTGSELFSALDEEALARVAVRASTVHLDRNDTLFNEGDEAEDLYVVLTGRVRDRKAISRRPGVTCGAHEAR